MKNILIPLDKTVFIPIGLTAATSATDAVIQMKLYISGIITSIISIEKMKDAMQIVKSLEEPYLLIIRVIERYLLGTYIRC